ncbi:hypothetical protein L873DRAFT_1114249 [Choiromyces venosus 120613-1]|uniref:Uncharacterized protein n=1 Tax=Choiromyces venosus 120613-1 TaxID=1336337 RepID=A0A3N4JH29_9PEZI|nr:hypothetical protein L873DRAFT_1114249 [Choiromyces venosus 120613-1]
MDKKIPQTKNRGAVSSWVYMLYLISPTWPLLHFLPKPPPTYFTQKILCISTVGSLIEIRQHREISFLSATSPEKPPIN